MISFPRRREPELKREILEARITIGGYTMSFNSETTRWLGIYLDTGLQFRLNRNLTPEKARCAVNRIWSLAAIRGMAPELVWWIRVAIIPALVPYGAEKWWNRQKGWCEEYQKLINRQSRAVTEMFKFTPIGIVTHEAGLEPAWLLLNNQQRRYRYRLLAPSITQPACNILLATLRDSHQRAWSEL